MTARAVPLQELPTRAASAALYIMGLGDVERDGQALALTEWSGAVPHGRREQDQPPGLGLDRPEFRQVDFEGWSRRVAERQISRFVFPEVRRKDNVKRRADPACRVHVVGMVPLALKAH